MGSIVFYGVIALIVYVAFHDQINPPLKWALSFVFGSKADKIEAAIDAADPILDKAVDFVKTKGENAIANVKDLIAQKEQVKAQDAQLDAALAQIKEDVNAVK